MLKYMLKTFRYARAYGAGYRRSIKIVVRNTIRAYFTEDAS